MPIRSLNILGLLGVCAILIVAFFYQFVFGELPCPLCLLQRSAFVALGLGFLLNIRFDSSPAHYGLMLVSAVIGAGTALRQILLHIGSGDPGYGSALLGLHFYSWAFVAFAASVLYVGFLLFLETDDAPREHARAPSTLAAASLWLFALLIAGNLASTLLECGVGPCADNPTVYDWLHS
jgi:disulfide bond formation protein DsbB